MVVIDLPKEVAQDNGLKYVVLANRSHLGNKHDLLQIEYGLPASADATAFEER